MKPEKLPYEDPTLSVIHLACADIVTVSDTDKMESGGSGGWSDVTP